MVTTTPTQGSFSIRARGRARRFDGVPVDEPVQLELPSGRSPPQGAILDALAVVDAPAGPEDGFDERTWLRRQGVHVVLHVDDWRQIGARGGLGGVADRLRRWLARSIAPGLSGERRSVLEGIVLGEGSSLSPQLRHDFQASGLYHLLAVSGQNVVLVAAGALILAWLLGVARWIGELGALAGIVAYVLAVGPQPSVIRAGIAGSLASLAWLSGRLRDAWYALLLGGDRAARVEPVPGLRPGLPALVRRGGGDLHGRPRDRPPPRGWSAAARSSARGRRVGGLRLVTAPILWLQFGYLPLLGVPANALAEPAMPVLLGLAFVTGGPRGRAAVGRGGRRVAERLGRRLHRALRPRHRLAAVCGDQEHARARRADRCDPARGGRAPHGAGGAGTSP